MLAALDHIILAVRDLDAAARGWQALLGRAPSWRGSHPGQGTANVLFRLDNMYLELMAATGSGALAGRLNRHLDDKGEGVYGLCFATGDIDAAARLFAKRGLAPLTPVGGEGRDDLSGAIRTWRLLFLPLKTTRGLFVFVIAHDGPPDTLPFRDPPGDPIAAVNALDHAVITTSDADALIALLGEKGLGLRLARDITRPRWGGRMMFFRLNQTTIEAVARTGSTDPDRFWGLAWRVPEIHAAHKRLAAHGFDISPVRKGRKDGTLTITLRDAPGDVPTLLIGPA